MTLSLEISLASFRLILSCCDESAAIRLDIVFWSIIRLEAQLQLFIQLLGFQTPSLLILLMLLNLLMPESLVFAQPLIHLCNLVIKAAKYIVLCIASQAASLVRLGLSVLFDFGLHCSNQWLHLIIIVIDETSFGLFNSVKFLLQRLCLLVTLHVIVFHHGLECVLGARVLHKETLIK